MHARRRNRRLSAGARRLIRPNAIFRRAGLLETPSPLKIVCDAHAMTLGGAAHIYITNPQRRDELLPKVKALFDGVEGIARRVDPEEFAAFKLPSKKENAQMPDFILLAKPGYAFHNAPQESEPVTDVGPDAYAGHHGFPNSDPEMDGVFFAWGHGIKPGARIERIANAVALGRDLINTPANDMGPAELEAAAREIAEKGGAKISVVAGETLIAQNYPMIHAVGRASTRAPRLTLGRAALLPTLCRVGLDIMGYR